ncbi:MAG: lytic transglycosylase domain-containing protein [Planctomycetota bacterium]
MGTVLSDRRFSPWIAPDEERSRARLIRQRLYLYGTLGVLLALSVAMLLYTRTQLGPDVHTLAVAAAKRHGLEPRLVTAVVRAESGGRVEARSKAGAFGLMQLTLPTASELAGRPLVAEDLFEPRLNLDLGCRYLRQLLDRYRGDLRLALMAYNAGPGSVAKWRKKTRDVDAILEQHAFGETRHYVRKVIGFMNDA